MLSTRGTAGVQHRAVNACLRPITALADTHVTTIEGIGNVHDGLDRVQHCLAINNGTQCGYCTPGFVMNMHAYLRQNPKPTSQEIENLFGGNLCRCTGYRPILQGMRSFACDGAACANGQMKCEADPFFAVKIRSEPASVAVDELPNELCESTPLHFCASNAHWFRPTRLAEAQELKRLLSEPTTSAQVRVVVGNTARDVSNRNRALFHRSVGDRRIAGRGNQRKRFVALARRRRSSGYSNWRKKQSTSGRPPKPSDCANSCGTDSGWLAFKCAMQVALAGIFSSSKAIRAKARLSHPIC